MFRLLRCAVIALAMIPAPLFAAGQGRFPYKAVVDGGDVYARSGPGRNYYPTSKLKPGQEVLVHRHDPGGWYMISPPPGSFSWIRADYVKTESPGRGLLTENNVIVRVGSDFGDQRDIEQVRLSKGDGVEILGEQSFSTQFGSVRMYKIAPPRGEYRWVPGRNILPAGGIARSLNDRDPYKIPSQVKRRPDGSHEIGQRANSGKGPKLHAPGSPVVAGSYERDRQQLAALDARLKSMIDQEAAAWDFTQLEAEYLILKQNASHPLMVRKVNERLSTIGHYRLVKAEYEKMIRLTSLIEQRDAQLAGKSIVPRPGNPQALGQPPGGGTAAGPILAAPHQTYPPAVTLPAPEPKRTLQRFSPPVPLPHKDRFQPPRTEQPPPQNTSDIPQFDGAGIIRAVQPRSPGMPAWGLFAPDGRLLAYLQPVPGLSLQRYVNRPMGVFGQRTHKPEWGTDYILVRAMMPVRLLRP